MYTGLGSVPLQAGNGHTVAVDFLSKRIHYANELTLRVRYSRADDTYVNDTGKAAGWGTLYENGKPSCVLQQVDVPIMDNVDCAKTNYTGELITDNMLCAGYQTGGKDSCQGDSGGPLMRAMADKPGRYEIIGTYRKRYCV